MNDERPPTIFVVTEFKRDSKIESYWYECFHDEDFHGYDVKVIDGTFFGGSDSFLFSDTFFKSIQLRGILKLIEKKQIRDGDVFVFANAWNFTAVPLSYFRDEFQLNIHMFGFWGDSLFNQESPMYERFKGKSKRWGRQFELTLFNAYDMNCFLCKEHWDMFRAKFNNLKGSRKNQWNDQVISRYAITGYPFEYLKKESYVGENKRDMIVFPYSLKEDLQRDIFADLKTQMPEYEFVFAQEDFNNRLLYHGLLKDAKMMFCANKSEYNPVLLYEAMMCGVWPMVPNISFYTDSFPEKYQYISLYGKGKYLYELRNKHDLMEYIRGIMDSYDTLQASLIRDGNKIGKKYYMNNPFLKVLEEVCGRPPVYASAKVRSKYRRQLIDRVISENPAQPATDNVQNRLNVVNK